MEQPQVKCLDAAASWQLIDQGIPVIDVRSAVEFAAGHLQGATNVPLDSLGQWAQQQADKQQALLLYCGAGIRAQKGCDLLCEQGFMAVSNAGALKDLLSHRG
ncbi:rhodanese-like domain-containing protein [Shewanella sedimentimangrovi]|uniref:Rhodanese-like domain-containing protein n=1 Tax=Shewanella sedimentimangrovi TaxID=2814293 RepID=A0ABX7QZT4_9GAMM|nr:rhodanese-like domain-containing protein [Shewanella sedimentimangrovi]QSX37062.1 rhodanese-like domain-containing protein [Shewanella sedimentimangrovi]